MTPLQFIGKLQETFQALWGKTLMILLKIRKLEDIRTLKLLIALCVLWDRPLASKGSWGGSKMETFHFFPLSPHRQSVDDGRERRKTPAVGSLF